mmetsp:Transcript_11864/g.37109  ORF Transcript_11864/g.37109 Transcript_11864/m.37109 type:complete len:336 (+) Transcript_11864:969-1976(+)
MELRERPVHRGKVEVPYAPALILRVVSPALEVGSADAVPEAPEEVVEGDQAQDEPQDPGEDEEEVGVDTRQQLMKDTLELHDAEKAHEPEQPQGAQDGHAGEKGETIRDKVNPIGSHDEHVQREPGPDILLGHPLGVQGEHAVDVGPSAEVQGDVGGPVDGRYPTHGFDPNVIWQPNDLHRDHDNVPHDDEHAEDVPQEPALGLRVHHRAGYLSSCVLGVQRVGPRPPEVLLLSGFVDDKPRRGLEGLVALEGLVIQDPGLAQREERTFKDGRPRGDDGLGHSRCLRPPVAVAPGAAVAVAGRLVPLARAALRPDLAQRRRAAGAARARGSHRSG